jgi:hypothetical protein
MLFNLKEGPSCVLPSEWEEQVATDEQDIQEYEQAAQTDKLAEE